MRFIYPEENATLVFDNLDAKLIECRTTGSLRPNMSWMHGNDSLLGGDVVKRIHVANASTPPFYVLQLNMISPVPYLDSGEYVCVVSNEWEVASRSVTVIFELVRGSKL